jgi:signal transduction histidine kinase
MPTPAAPHLRQHKPHHHSVFFKLFIVLLGAVILTYVAFGGFYRSEWNASNRIESHPSLMYYWGLLAERLGAPPDTVLAASLSEDIGIAIGVTGPLINWHSENFPEYAWPEPADFNAEEPVDMYIRGGRIWGVISRGEYTYHLGTRRRTALEGLTTDSFSLLAVIALVWFASWMILRRMLRPLISLETGVEAVDAGRLDVKIPEGGRDEFSRLARAFNNMTRSLRDRLKSRDQLLLDVSHELRSPLTRMRLALEMIDPDRAKEKIRKEIGLLEAMASEILETERLESPTGLLKLVPTNLEHLVRERVSQYSEQGLKISLVADKLPPIMLDPERIRVVLQNIFDNAMKYGQSGFRPVNVLLHAENHFAVVEVQDFGIGIPEKDLPFIFEPFYRADPSRSRVRGYGLGLGLSKRIVEMHGGKILIESRHGERTVVTVKLPLG